MKKKTEDILIFQTGYKEKLKAAAGLNKHELFLIKITVFECIKYHVKLL